MARVRNMQGVPAHIETLKNKDKKRRHPSKCKYHEGKHPERICKCEKSHMFLCKCETSQHCEYYEE